MCVWCVYTCVRACVSVLVHTWVFKLNRHLCLCNKQFADWSPRPSSHIFNPSCVREQPELPDLLPGEHCDNDHRGEEPGWVPASPTFLPRSPKSLKVSVKLLVAHVLVCSSEHLERVAVSSPWSLPAGEVCLSDGSHSELSPALQGLSRFSALCFAASQSAVLLR